MLLYFDQFFFSYYSYFFWTEKVHVKHHLASLRHLCVPHLTLFRKGVFPKRHWTSLRSGIYPFRSGS